MCMSVEYSPPLDAIERLTGRHQADEAFTAAVRGARMAMVVVDPRKDDHPIVFVNDAFLALTGYAREEVLGRNCRFLQGPETDPRARARIRAAIREGRDTAVELLNYRKDGTPFWNGLFISPVRNAAGEVVFFFGSLLDVSRKKEAELALRKAHGTLETAVEQRTHALRETAEQKTVLLHEVEHRVKNNLQLISSLIQFQARRTQDPGVRAALREVQERVSAISTVHRRLFQTQDAARFDVAQFLRDLVDDLLGRTCREDIIVELTAEPAWASAAKAAPMALLVNEVLAHTIRAGLPEGRPGRLRLELKRTEGRLSLEISHDGEGSVDEVRRRVEGPSGIIGILRRQLRAEIEWRDNQPGVTALISLPVERS